MHSLNQAATIVPPSYDAHRPTDAAPALSSTNAPTWPPMSSNRQAGMLWAERLMRLAAPASSDAARFMAGL